MENKATSKFIVEDIEPRFIVEDITEDAPEQTQADQTTDQPEVVSVDAANVEPPKKQRGVVAKTVASTPKKNTVSGSEVGSSEFRKNKFVETDSNKEIDGVSVPRGERLLKPKKEIKYSETDNKIEQGKKILQTGIERGKERQKLIENQQVKSKPNLRPISEFEAEKQKEESDSFSNYLKEAWDSAASTVVKSVYEAPEYAYEFIASNVTDPVFNKARELAGEKPVYSSADKIMDTFNIRNVPADILKERINKSNKVIEDYSLKNGVDPLTAIENKNYIGAMKLTAGLTVQSSPLMLAALLSGGSSAAMAGIAASTAVTKSGELKAEQPEMDVQARVNNAAVSGLLEGYLGNLFTGASGAVVKRIIADKGVDAGSKIISNGLMSTLEKTIAKNPLVGVLGEVAEESAVELGNQLNDINSGIRTELDNRAIINAGIVATGMSGVNTVPIYAAKGYVKLADYNAVKKVNKEINRLSSQLTSQYIDDDSKKLISSRITRLVDSNKAILGTSLEKLNALPDNVKTEISDINLGIDDIRNQYIDILDNNDIDDNLKKSLVEELEVQARELSNRKSSIIEGNYIYEDFNKLPEVDKVKYKDLALVNLQEESVINGESKKSFDDASILKSASELYNADRKSADISTDIANTKRAAKIFGLSSNISMPEINNARDLYNYLSTNTNLKENEIEGYSESLGLFVPLTDSNGNPTGKRALIINKENADIENVVTTGQHEFLHELLYNSVKNDPAAQKKIGTALYKYLDSTMQTEEFNNTTFKKRYETYKSDFESKKLIIEQKLEKAKTWLSEGRITQEQYDTALESGNNNISTYEGNFLEETLPLLSESLSSGDIKYNETFFTKLGDILRRFFQKYGLKKISFETGKDVFNFVKDYNKSFEKGEFGKAFKSLKEGKANIAKGKAISKTSIKESIASPKVVALEKELQDLEDEYDEGYGDMADDEYRAKKNNIEAKIKTTIRKEAEVEASGKKVVVEKEPTSEEEEVKKIIREERGSLSSDKVQQIYAQKGLNGAQDIINLFKPITKKIVDKRRDAPGFDRELLTDEIETGDGGILDLIRKYKPESGVPLAAYINKYLPLRAIATSRRILDAQFSKDVTEEVGLMATETADQNMTERVAEKPKYKNVLESNVFEPEVLKTMIDKVVTNIRTLKSRIDAPTSLNRTISPLMAEITAEMGKQLDIDIKTEMGGKKDNQLKNWLIKNKRYVLENMTTTWLMGLDGKGGIPQAIQKKIDGRWVNFPEWVGQKIDRETTSTDLAGRTSGRELARRLPGVFNNVSNEDYLATILEPGGNPIRGRKESLAKAIAEETSIDLINNDFQNEGPIYEAFITNQERIGVEVVDNVVNEFAKQAERGNVKQSLAVKDGLKQSKDKLAYEIFNAPDAESEVNVIKRWIASDGRSIRTLAYIIFGKTHKWTKNKGIFEEILAPIISSSSKYNWLIGKDSFKLKDVPRGQSIYFGEDKVPLWEDTEYVKRNWENSIDTINEEAKEATNEIIDIVNYYKNNNKFTEKEFRNYLSILKYDQRGLIRKLNKAGLGVLGMNSSNEPYLEHNKPSYDVSEDVVSFFKGEMTEGELRSAIDESKVNLVPKEINNFLPKYKKGENRMHNDDVVLYLQSLIDSGFKISNIESEYGSKSEFDKMVAAAKAKVITKHDLTIDEELNLLMLEAETTKQSIAKSEEFNKIIEDVKGVDRSKVFSDITARRRGAGLNKYDFYVPPSAADFELLLYNFMGKGALGEEHKKFFDDQFLKPYSHGIDLMDSARQDIKNDFKSISNAFPKVKKKLESLIPDKDFTYDQALRVAIWSESSAEIPGLSRRDQTKLADLVNNDVELNAFKEGLKRTSRQPDGWLKPEDFWETKTIISDLHDITEGVGRKKFLEEFIGNVEAIFGKWNNGKLVGENMNKIEATYGANVREALEDSLYRMSNGKNRSSGQDKEASAWMNWVNGSTGAIMFLNTRSALLQLTGAVNFLNLRDNNPIMAAKAFANQPQYWSDFAMIFNSDKIKERRSGLKDDVSAAEIANAAKGAKNKAGAVLSYLLKIGYTPTQIADSLAIAIGGAPFYRNRVNSYKSEYEGLDDNGNLKRKYSDDQAETMAWDDFSKVSDETQQSGDPRDISKQQASSVGRLILAFQNTSMQQSRIIKKSYLDLKNGRGDAITNIAKITYYLAIQNTMFAVLQSGLFALMFDEDDEDDKEKAKKKKTGEDKALEIGNSVLDSVLRGTGFGGAIVATLKNIAVKYMEESDKGFKGDYTKVLLEGANISPPIGSKARKAYSAMQTSKYEKGLMDRRKWDITQNGRVHLSPRYHVGAKAIEAVTNVPLDRFVNKVENISEAMNAENKAWQRVMVGLGYTPYSVGIQNTGDEEIKAEIKAEKKIASKEKAKAKREFVKDSIASLPPEEYLKYLEKKGESKQKKKDSIAALSPEEYIKYLEYKNKKRGKSTKASSAGKFIVE